jgi:hypothetical protein
MKQEGVTTPLLQNKPHHLQQHQQQHHHVVMLLGSRPAVISGCPRFMCYTAPAPQSSEVHSSGNAAALRSCSLTLSGVQGGVYLLYLHSMAFKYRYILYSGRLPRQLAAGSTSVAAADQLHVRM